MKLRWWHKHQWSKWVTYGNKILSVYDECTRLSRIELRQRRHCELCGLTQDEHVSYSNNIDDLKGD